MVTGEPDYQEKTVWYKLPYNDIRGFAKTNCIIKDYI